jgi:GNAT superfamily N-acetyltransferase
MIEIRLLSPKDDRSKFCSGNPELDRFFSRYAGQNQFRHHIGATYIAIEKDTILGYVTVTASHIEIENLPQKSRKSLPSYPLPVLRLARLAVDEEYRNNKIGTLLLRSVFHLAHEMAQKVGCLGVVVDAKKDAIEFYRQLGFEPLELVEGWLEDRPEPVAMFLALGSIPKK